jgi:hypothetical protein
LGRWNEWNKWQAWVLDRDGRQGLVAMDLGQVGPSRSDEQRMGMVVKLRVDFNPCHGWVARNCGIGESRNSLRWLGDLLGGSPGLHGWVIPGAYKMNGLN